MKQKFGQKSKLQFPKSGRSKTILLAWNVRKKQAAIANVNPAIFSAVPSINTKLHCLNQIFLLENTGNHIVFKTECVNLKINS